MLWEEKAHSMNELFTKVFVEQPLASPGSANNTGRNWCRKLSKHVVTKKHKRKTWDMKLIEEIVLQKYTTDLG